MPAWTTVLVSSFSPLMVFWITSVARFASTPFSTVKPPSAAFSDFSPESCRLMPRSFALIPAFSASRPRSWRAFSVVLYSVSAFTSCCTCLLILVSFFSYCWFNSPSSRSRSSTSCAWLLYSWEFLPYCCSISTSFCFAASSFCLCCSMVSLAFFCSSRHFSICRASFSWISRSFCCVAWRFFAFLSKDSNVSPVFLNWAESREASCFRTFSSEPSFFSSFMTCCAPSSAIRPPIPPAILCFLPRTTSHSRSLFRVPSGMLCRSCSTASRSQITPCSCRSVC